MRCLSAFVVPLVLALSPQQPQTCLLAPVRAPVVVPFRAPECTYCPGQRGVEYGVSAGATVRVALGGIVTFSGVVAGTRYVVVAQVDGLLATYGMLADTSLRAGERVSTGYTMGHASGRLYFGLRLDRVYVDPVPRIGVATRRGRLVPNDGSRGRPSPEGPVRCGIAVHIVAASGAASR